MINTRTLNKTLNDAQQSDYIRIYFNRKTDEEKRRNRVLNKKTNGNES